jgi:nucleoside-diphosphate-sugar epimerase/2-polyprenyl-3-methyl-5-hydroxy-6-metoxy-1,4-benzoquinol methylase
MKILVIGGTGYIGSRFVDICKDKHPLLDIVVVDSDNYIGSMKKRKDVNYINIKYQELPNNFFSEFSNIILLAGQGSVSNSNNILNVIDNNIRNFAWLLEQISNDQKLIYASSSSVYGRTNNKEVNEEFLEYEPYNYYDLSKQTIDQFAKLSQKHYYSLRFGTVSGFSRNLRNDVMINSMVYNAKKNDKIFVYNNEINRPILGINDLCNAILTIVFNGRKELSGIYNLNSFNATVDEIASKVSKLCNVSCENTKMKNEQIINFKLQTTCYDFKINSYKFMKSFNFKFEDTIESIINELIENWKHIENYENRLRDKYISYKLINKCKVCGNNTQSLLNLGEQPLANSYMKYDVKIEENFPLHLHYCNNCYHTQLNCVVIPDKLFKNYLYISGTSNTLKTFFSEFALFTLFNHFYKTNKTNSTEQSSIKILDIACNDGSQLDAFHDIIRKLKLENLEIITIGVDPAENIYRDISSRKSEHDIYCEFFTQTTVNKLKEKHGSFDIIIAQNVFAHIDYPGDFLKYTKQLMNDNSSFYIQTSQKNMILNNQFDTVYHEHLSFFNTKSMNILCERNGLILNNVYENDIHGTSYIFDINKYKINYGNIDEILKKELNDGLYNDSTYKRYNLKCIQYKNNFKNKIIDYKLKKMSVIAFGSTAKSMTVFNFCNITNKEVEFMIDENKLKQGLYTPGSHILVGGIDYLKNIESDCVILITAWNFYKEIKEKIIKKVKEYNIKYSVTLLNIDTLEDETLEI